MKERKAAVFVYQSEREKAEFKTNFDVYEFHSQVYKSHYVYSSVNHRQAKW